MKVLFSVFRYHTNMVSMVKALKQGGHEVLILAVAKEPYEAEHDSLVKIIESTGQLLCQVKTVFEQFQPDAVVVRAALNEDAAPIVAREAKKRRIKCISYEQNPCYHSSPFKALYIGLSHARRQLKKGLPIMQISPRRGTAKGYRVPFRRYFHFPMCGSAKYIDRDYYPDGVVRVTAVGKLGVQRKRLDWIVDALDSIDEKVSVTLVGANDIDKYPQLRSRKYYNMLYEKSLLLRESGVLTILEDVPFREMERVYENTDVFVLPSKGEMFGISVLEAMSYGCAVICADDNGVSPCVTQDCDGLIFQSSNYKDFKDQLCDIIVDKEKIKRLGRAAVSTIRENHSCSGFLSRFVCSIRRV